MSDLFLNQIRSHLKHQPVYDPDFVPIGRFIEAYQVAVSQTESEPICLSLIRAGGCRETRHFRLFKDESTYHDLNCVYIERLLKTLLWLRGGYNVQIAGPEYIVNHLRESYHPQGKRRIDIDFLQTAYGQPFRIESVSLANIKTTRNRSQSIGGHSDGCRIGLDVGGSVRKVAALKDGVVLFTNATHYTPKTASSIDYLYQELSDSIRLAKDYLPRVDAIGFSTAGIVIDDSIRVGSVIREIVKEDFPRVLRLFSDLAEDVGATTYAVANDGEVTALAGSLALNKPLILGITMGTSQGAGYVDDHFHVRDWLNEVCFVPVDLNPAAHRDEWSQDHGVGVSYFSQDALIKLAYAAGIKLTAEHSPAENFRLIRAQLDQGDSRARQIFLDIGTYLGYTIPYYLKFLPATTVLLMGGVMSGEGGDLILHQARTVLRDEYPEVAERVALETFPDEVLRVGLAVVAAGLPE